MKKTAVILLVIITALTACKKEEKHEPTNGKLNISVTLLPYADIVKQLGKEKVHVTTLIPPGSTPETYEPSFKQLTDAAKSELYIRVGSFFVDENPWISSIEEFNGKIEIINSAEGIELIDNNPHVWLGVQEIRVIAGNIADALSKTDTASAEYYRNNLNEFVTKLTSSADSLQNKLKTKKNRIMLVHHPAWTYLCSYFNLEQLAIEDHGHEPNPRELKNLIETAKENKIRALFLDRQLNPESSKAIAEEIGAEIVPINALPNYYLENLMDIGDKLYLYLD